MIDRARVSKGAFYYHFDSKEGLARAIIEEGANRLLSTFRAITAARSPALENIVSATFVVAALTGQDLLVCTAEQLRRSLGQVSSAGSPTYQKTLSAFREQVVEAIRQADVEWDVEPEDVAQTICAAILGCHLLTDAMDNDLYTRLAGTWRILLRGIVPSHSWRYFNEFVGRIALR